MTTSRIRAKLAWLVLAAAVLLGGPARADDPRCVCEHRDACYHYLNAPVGAPDDPCSCERCASGIVHHPGESVPEGWDRACFASNRMDCFLKRHAASWGITCSACLAEDSCCKLPGHATCPRCGTAGEKDPFEKDALRQDARATMAEQLPLEQRFFDAKNVVVAYSRRFYVVTDIPKIRILDQDGSPRWATTHEYAHIMVQRAEMAFDELSELVGGRIKLLRPMGIYLPKSERDGRKLQAEYFRAERTHMIYSSYAGRGDSLISGSFCLNGICVPLERVKQSAAAARSIAGDDYALHGSMRHLVAHVLLTCWVVRHGENRTMPRWAFVGSAHWFCKRTEKHEDVVYYCTGETGTLSGSGKDWRDQLRKRALADDLAPIEELLRKSSLGQLDQKDHVQCWGYFDVAMESPDWHDEWVAMFADLREEKDVRAAFQDRLGMTPEQFHAAWRERLLGKEAGDAPPDTSTTGEKLDAGDDPAVIAAALQGLGVVSDPALVAKVLDVVGTVHSDLVRETGLAVLLRTEDPKARAAIVEGLDASKPLARAYAARACRLMGLADAKPRLRALIGDAHWLVRSEAALASATLRDFDAQRGIRDLTQDDSDKARIGALDALAIYGREVNEICLPLVAKNLEHDRFQVRIAAAQCLAAIGNHEVMTPLIDRLEKESGRVADVFRETLVTLAGEDFGADAGVWRKWWEHERPHAEERGGLAVTGPPKEKKDEPPSRYAEDQPTYYGRDVFSQRVVFVLDTSRSTNRSFRADSRTRERLMGDYGDGAREVTINEISRAELGLALEKLDPRARFNVVCFASDVATWQDGLQTASAGNKRSAASFARSRAPNGETNFHGALLAALEIGRDPWAAPDLANTADTVHFLTDGDPSAGDVVDPEQLGRWFLEINRYSRSQLNIIVFGALGVNESFLKKLARDGGGSFTQLFER